MSRVEPAADGPPRTTPVVSELEAAALRGATRAELLADARAAHGPHVDVIASTPGADPAADRPLVVRLARHAGRRVAPIEVGGQPVAFLVADPAAIRDDAFESTLRAVTIEASCREAVATAARESLDWLLDELRFGPADDAAALVAVGDRLDLDLRAPQRAVVLIAPGVDEHRWRSAVASLPHPARATGPAAWTVVTDPRVVERLRRRLEAEIEVATYAVTGRAVAVADLPQSFKEAEVMVALLQAEGPRRQLVHDDLGLSALLLVVPLDELEAFVGRWLDPLADHDELCRTLEVWIDSGGSWLTSAERLFIHRNSVGYRLQKIREHLGADPLDPGVARQIRAAFEARRVLTARRRVDDGTAPLAHLR